MIARLSGGLIAVALVALALALTVTEAEAGGRFHKCGDAAQAGAGSYDVRASKGVRCPDAKRVARRFFPGGDDHYKGWRCRGRQTALELGKATCRRGKKPNRDVIKFIYGS